MRLRLLLLGPALLVPAAFLACGDSNDDPGSGGETSSDEEYLAVFCAGLTKYQETLVSATTETQIGDVIKGYIDELHEVAPAEGLQEYHSQYIGYLEDALRDPTSLVTRKPPLPPEDARERLSAKAKTVEQCKYPTFLDQPATPKG